MFKSNKGFTLVELIVVIAILAILAGVAIPVYNGYIKRAQDAAVVTELDAIQTAAQAANATSGQIEIIVVDGTNIYVGGASNKLAAAFNGDFVLFYPDATASANLGQFTATIDLGNATYKDGATWKDGDWAPGTETVPAQEAGASLGGTNSNTNNNNNNNNANTNTHTCTYTTYTSNNDATCLKDGTKTATCDNSDCSNTNTITDDGTKLTHVDGDDADTACDNGCGYILTNGSWGLPITQ